MTIAKESTAPAALASRRAVLAAAAGAAAALGAAALGRPSPVRAGSDGDVTIGFNTPVSTSTELSNSVNTNFIFKATSQSGIALYGASGTNTGVYATSGTNFAIQGHSTSSLGVYGSSGSDVGIYASSSAASRPAGIGASFGNSTGLQGSSGAVPASTPAKTGVYGYASQDANSVGVRGESPAGFGVYGKTSSGYAGYFNGKVFSSQFVELAEIVTPAAPGGNRGRLFMRDNGSGKTQLCVKFPTGGTIVLATQP
jgi:hypothetical protein